MKVASKIFGLIALLLLWPLLTETVVGGSFVFGTPPAWAGDSYAADDAHNHDGSHPDSDKNCGGNYMLPGEVARLGSHTFMILGQDDDHHIIAEHRSGTPPHNYQFILRVRLDDPAMAFYKKLLKESKTLPSFTTIYYADNGDQLDRTFFCLADLPKIFGDQQKAGDAFEKLFPIRASLLKDADHEGDFDFKKTFYPGGHFEIKRSDVQLLVYRYLPAYLPQDDLRKAIKEKKTETVSRFYDGPLTANEPVETASKRSSYMNSDGRKAAFNEVCPRDPYLKKINPPKTIHSFLLMFQDGPNSVVAVHYPDWSPQNFQTVVRLKLTPDEMTVFLKAKTGAKTAPLFQTKNFFCMANLREQIRKGEFHAHGTVYRDSNLGDYSLGQAIGDFDLNSSNVEVVVNRTLVSLLNPFSVASEVLHGDVPRPPDFVDVSKINPTIKIDMRYFSDWNFTGRRVDGYEANMCLLTRPAAEALSRVQDFLKQDGYSLVIFDCYRPQRAVENFVRWAGDLKDLTNKKIFYPEEPKETLFERGYIAYRSGHSRGSTMDLSIVRIGPEARDRRDKSKERMNFHEKPQDCRRQRDITQTGQLDMGTTFDCFSDLANTANPEISPEAAKNREILKSAMEKFGFVNYDKEWWHYTLKDEPYTEKYFDFPVQ